MYILLNIVVALSCLIIGYLIGAFPTGVFIGKVFFRKDPRDYYSHNSGGTNCGRVFGKKIGALVMVIDCIKIVIPVFMCWAILTFSGLNKAFVDAYERGMWDIPLYYYLAAIGTAIGHCYPIYIGFKGGKCAANFIGFVLCFSWVFFLCNAVYLIMIKVKKYVSLSIIVQIIVDFFVAWILFFIGLKFNNLHWIIMWGWNKNVGFSFGAQGGWEYPLTLTIIGALCIIRHKENIQRLINGTERKVTWIK